MHVLAQVAVCAPNLPRIFCWAKEDRSLAKEKLLSLNTQMHTDAEWRPMELRHSPYCWSCTQDRRRRTCPHVHACCSTSLASCPRLFPSPVLCMHRQATDSVSLSCMQTTSNWLLHAIPCQLKIYMQGGVIFGSCVTLMDMHACMVST